MTQSEAMEILSRVRVTHGPLDVSSLSVSDSVHWVVDPIFNLGTTPALRSVILAKDTNPPHNFMKVYNSWPMLSLEFLTEQDLLDTARCLLLDAVVHELDEAFTYDGERIYDPHKARE